MPSTQTHLEAWIADHLSNPWPDPLTHIRGYAPGRDVPASALYDRYVADCTEAGVHPATRNNFGITLAGWPGVTKTDVAEGHVYDGVTLQSRQERAVAEARPAIWQAAMTDQSDQPWHQRWTAHRDKHLDLARETGSLRALTCNHPQPPDVEAGLAEVEDQIAPRIEAAVDDRYGPYLDWRPTGPNPRLVALLEAGEERLRWPLIRSGDVAIRPEDEAWEARFRRRMGPLLGLPPEDDERFDDY